MKINSQVLLYSVNLNTLTSKQKYVAPLDLAMEVIVGKLKIVRS